LIKDEHLRFCSLYKIKELNFFKSINFDKLSKKEVPAPIIPAVVKINYHRELNNVRTEFNNFIQNEIVESKTSNANKNENVHHNNKHKVDFDHHKNIMKWYDKF
jgi:hypothetical protein